MNIELLNVKISILENKVTVDAIGNHSNKWVPYYNCHATVSSEVGKEATTAGTVIDDSKIDFTIRWCKQASSINSTLHRVEFNGETYEIKGIDHMNFKRKCIKLSCEKVRR